MAVFYASSHDDMLTIAPLISLQALAGVAAVAVAVSLCRPSVDDLSQLSHSFAKFWPLYLSQHVQPATKLLHALGTSHVILFPWLCYGAEAALRTVLSLAIVLSAALPFADLLLGLSSPSISIAIEFIAVALAFTVACRVLVGAPPRFALLLCMSCYGPPFLSHLLIERNSPMTFRYGPAYSILGDLRMLATLALGQLSLSDGGA